MQPKTKKKAKLWHIITNIIIATAARMSITTNMLMSTSIITNIIIMNIIIMSTTMKKAACATSYCS